MSGREVSYLVAKNSYMEKRFVAGLDIAKDKFDVSIKVKKEDGSLAIKGSSHFSNDKEGFDKFLAWVFKRTKGENNGLHILMEATGVYYEELAHYLYEQQIRVYVVLPNKVRNYLRSLNIKTKTDKTDAHLLAQMGFEQTLTPWKPMSGQYIELRDLTRAILALQKDLVIIKSRLHALLYSKNKSDRVRNIYEREIAFIEKSIQELRKERKKLTDKDPMLKEKIKNLTTIKRVGFDTAIGIIAETNGFELFTSQRQLVSYAGLDVSHNQSGTKTRASHISKKGNARIRHLLFMPAISAVAYNKPIRLLHQRIKERNPKHPIKGVVAGMRKLLLQIYTLYKKDQPFDEDYKWGKEI